MPTPLNDTLKEVNAAGSLIRQVGPIVVLSIAVVVLGVALTFSIVTSKVGADRWTRTDHMKYVQQHDKEVNLLVDQLLREHNAVHEKENDKQEKMATDVTTIHEDVAVLKSTVKRMEGDVQIIKAAVMKMEKDGSK